MGIRIEKITVHSCGPVDHFDEEIKPLTLVYSRNERGKTTIVENVIASLFRNRKDKMYPFLRGDDFVGSSTVMVSGIGRKLEGFSPSKKRKKIDSLLEERDNALPGSLFNLLFVRGAETDIIKGGGSGITKTGLKNLISRQRVYDVIRGKLPKAVGYTEFQDGILTGEKRGEYKTYQENKTKLEEFSRLSDEFHARLSQTELIELEAKADQLGKERQTVQLAKRHYAFKLSREIEALKLKLSQSVDERIRKFGDNVKECNRQKESLKKKEEKLEEYGDVDVNSRWIDEAQKCYENLLGQARNILQRICLILAAVLGVLTGLTYFIPPLKSLSSVGIPLVEVCLGLTLVTILLLLATSFFHRGVKIPESAQEELRRIEKEFRDRFGVILTSSVDFASLKETLNQDIGSRKQLEDDLSQIRSTIEFLKGDIRHLLEFLDKSGTEEECWVRLFRELEESWSKGREDLVRLQGELDNLDVDTSDYLGEFPGTDYSAQREKQTEDEIASLKERIEEERNELDNVKNKLAEHISYETAMTGSLEDIATAIETKILEYRNLAHRAYASMIAAHVVDDVLTVFQKEEDTRLEEAINEGETVRLIEKFTRRYNRIYLEGDEVEIGSNEAVYHFGSLSTGAQEQILLALRMGIARKLSGKETLFLVLDDAFQYSDWERRQYLIDQVIEIVKDGWQVIYFTMDDDIRDRFLKAAETLPPENFRMITL